MATITKKDLVERIAERTHLPRSEIKRVIQDFLDSLVFELEHGNRIEFREFGVFEVRERAARLAQNPKTMQKISVPPRRAVKFKPGRLMRERIERPVPPLPMAEVKSPGKVAVNR
jgi:integration host factor subunit beta